MAQIQLNGTADNFTGIHPSLAGDIDLSDVGQNFARALEEDIKLYTEFDGSRRKARAYFMNGSLENVNKKSIRAIESEAKVIQETNDPKIQAENRRTLISTELMDVTKRVASRIRGSLDAE